MPRTDPGGGSGEPQEDWIISAMKAVFVASLLAIAVQPLLFVFYMAIVPMIAGQEVPLADIASISVIVTVVAIPFVLLVGIPSALLLRRFGRLRYLPLVAIGFVFAALPIGYWRLPVGDAGYSLGGNFYGHVEPFIVNGEPTIWGLLDYAQSVLMFGLHGFVGASVFYVVFRRSSRRVTVSTQPC